MMNMSHSEITKPGKETYVLHHQFLKSYIMVEIPHFYHSMICFPIYNCIELSVHTPFFND